MGTLLTFDERDYKKGTRRSNNFKPIQYEIVGECWICKSHCGNNYSRIRRYGKYTRVHRYVYEYTNKTKIKEGNIILHSCDNPSCINPNHLSEGTQDDNMKDMKEKDRSTKGSRNWCAILKERDVWEIKHLLAYTKFQSKEIASLYNVKPNVIYQIKKSITWKHVNILNNLQGE